MASSNLNSSRLTNICVCKFLNGPPMSKSSNIKFLYQLFDYNVILYPQLKKTMHNKKSL